MPQSIKLFAFMLSMLAGSAPLLAQSIAQDISRIQIRVRRPLITMGPTSQMLDNPFSSIKLENGNSRGFTANQISYRIDGTDPWSNGGPAIAIMGKTPGTYASCGRWLNDEQDMGNGTYLGYAHAESDCDYAHGQTHKSMTLMKSTDEGGTWVDIGQIITGADGPTPNQTTGEGDCTAVQDASFSYLYCLRASDHAMTVNRAPLNNPYPGQWRKYYNGQWTQAGLGGLSSPAQYVTGASTQSIYLGTSSVSSWNAKNYTVLLNTNSPQFSPGGITIAFSEDHLNFVRLAQPLLTTDGPAWTRDADAPDLIAYPSIVATTGGRSWDKDFLLTYTYLAPGEGFSQRKLVFRSAYAWISSTPNPGNQPQVGVELSRWLDQSSSPQEIWTTTAPVPGNYSKFAYMGSLGYVMPSPLSGPGAPSTIALEECTSNWTGNTDHLIDWDGGCVSRGYKRLRTIGWIYTQAQPNTMPLYRCWSPTFYRSHFISRQADCEGKGNMEFLLGYVF